MVVKFLKNISPIVNEVGFNKILELSKNFSIVVIPFHYLESMLIVKIGNLIILNLNDCDIKNNFQLRFILKKLD